MPGGSWAASAGSVRCSTARRRRRSLARPPPAAPRARTSGRRGRGAGRRGRRARRRVGAALEHVVEHLAQGHARPASTASSPAGVMTRRTARRSPSAPAPLDEAPLDEPVDQRRQRRLRDGQLGRQLGRPLVAARQQPEHAVLRHRQLARAVVLEHPAQAGRSSASARPPSCRVTPELFVFEQRSTVADAAMPASESFSAR